MALAGAVCLASFASRVPAQTPPASSPSAQAQSASSRHITLAVVRPGNYVYWTNDRLGAGWVLPLTSATKEARVELTPETREVVVLNEDNRTLAIYPVADRSDGATIPVWPEDFKRVRLLIVRMVTENGEPPAWAKVTLRDSVGWQARRALTSMDQGYLEFRNARMGSCTLTATHGANGPTVTKQIVVAPGPRGAPPEVLLTIPGTVQTASAGHPARAHRARATEDQAAGRPSPAGLPNVPALEEAAEPVTPRSQPREAAWLLAPAAAAFLAALLVWEAARTRTQAPAPVSPRGEVTLMGAFPPPSLPRPATAVVAATAKGGVPRLVGLTSGMTGRIVPLSKDGTLWIGRDSGNTLPLHEDPTASRRHARVERRGEGFVVVDEGSSNGTWVNGTRTQEQELRPGDEMQIGTTRFRFEL